MSNENYRKKKEYIDTYKLASGCKFCGYSKCASALDFHHIGEDKEFNISQCQSLEKIKIEIRNCIVLCKNCHAGLHASGKEETLPDKNIYAKEMDRILKILSVRII